jgi:hypothetical protein
MNGYQIINQIAQRTGGAWKPSPGSVYPTIQQLEDEGPGGGRLHQRPARDDAHGRGRRYVEEHPDELAATWRPFDDAADRRRHPPGLKPAVGQVMGAVWQVATSGQPAAAGAGRGDPVRHPSQALRPAR